MNIGKATVLIVEMQDRKGTTETVRCVIADTFFDGILAISGETKQQFCNNFKSGFNIASKKVKALDVRYEEMQDAYVMDMQHNKQP